MSFRKFSSGGRVIETEGPISKTAGHQDWTDQDRAELAAENDAVDRSVDEEE